MIGNILIGAKIAGAVLLLIGLIWFCIHRHFRRRNAGKWSYTYAGAPGERLQVLVSLVDCIRFPENERSRRYRLRFRDEEGRCLVWWAETYGVVDHKDKLIKAGTLFHISAEISEHRESRGIRETIVVGLQVENNESPVLSAQPPRQFVAQTGD